MIIRLHDRSGKELLINMSNVLWIHKTPFGSKITFIGKEDLEIKEDYDEISALVLGL